MIRSTAWRVSPVAFEMAEAPVPVVSILLTSSSSFLLKLGLRPRLSLLRGDCLRGALCHRGHERDQRVAHGLLNGVCVAPSNTMALITVLMTTPSRMKWRMVSETSG